MVVVLVSPSTEQSFFLRDEILRAVERSRKNPPCTRLIPIFVGGTTPTQPSVPYGLRPKQGIVISNEYDLDAAAERIIELAVAPVLEDAEDESRKVSPSLRAFFAGLHQDVQQLTQDQYRVIQQLRYLRRVRISGCAGSGKTLVAAEKGSRLSAAGLRVLVLCHNPLLADHISRLVAGTGTEVADFVSWLSTIAGIRDNVRRSDWSHFNEPDQPALDRALEFLASINMKYDAIIVDEAQDFRDEWWVVVEAGLRSSSESFFYLFHDNHQSLLPHRGRYPIEEPHVDLSRNCRNAGRIFDLMRCFDNGSPETEIKLSSKGRVSLNFYEPGKECERVALLLRDFHRQDVICDTVILWAGTEPVSDCPLANLEVNSSEVDSWQDEVRRQFQKILSTYDPRGVTFPSAGDVWVSKELASLSQNQFPTNDDIERVRDVALAFNVHRDTAAKILSTKPYSCGFSWTKDNRRLRLRRKASGLLWAAEGILHFSRNDWYVGIPKPISLRVLPFFAPQSDLTIPLYAVPDFKGLEADVIILVIRGRTMNYRQATYVGVSRARAMLAILADHGSAATFPRTFKWDSVF